ncbi:hypothetical protein KCU62_g120, partial [Aureobasidium sp. EXF-3399]
MLVLCLWLESLADEHMIKLLAVHVEEVRESLELGDIRSLVEIFEIGDLLEVLERLDKRELVEVASDDNLGVLILGKDVGNKLLCLMSNESRMGSSWVTYGGQLHLILAVINATVHRRTSITFDGRGTSLASIMDVDGEKRRSMLKISGSI